MEKPFLELQGGQYVNMNNVLYVGPPGNDYDEDGRPVAQYAINLGGGRFIVVQGIDIARVKKWVKEHSG